MTNEVYSRNLATMRANKEKIDSLYNDKCTKLNRLAIYMLKGYPVTGVVMINKFNIYSYRDAIYNLGLKGYEINSKVVTTKNGVQHKVWWLSCYDEEFALSKEERIF